MGFRKCLPYLYQMAYLLVLLYSLLITTACCFAAEKTMESKSADDAKALIASLKKAVEDKNEPQIMGAYVSPTIYVRNQFLLAISKIGEPAIPLLTAEKKAAVGNAEMEKWLVLALGFAGDQSVMKELEKILKNEPDISTRWAAVHSYAKSGKQDALPLLKQLLKDNTEADYRDCFPSAGSSFPVQDAARDEINRLEGKTWQEKGKTLASKLQLTINAEKNEVEAGQPIMLSISMKNISSDELHIECSRNMYSEYTLSVVDAQNKEAKPTSFLIQFREDQRLYMDSLRGYTLKASQSADCSINACTFYDMTLPGKYFISLRRWFPLPMCLEGQTQVVSNTVEVKVVYPEEPYVIKEAN